MKNPIIYQPCLPGKTPHRKQDIERGLDYLERGLLDVGIDRLTGRLAWGRIISPNGTNTYWLMRDKSTGAFHCSCKWHRMGNMCKHSSAAYLADSTIEHARNEEHATRLVEVLRHIENEAMDLLANVIEQAIKMLKAIEGSNFYMIHEAPQGFPCHVCNSHLKMVVDTFKCETPDCWGLGFAFTNLANPESKVDKALSEDIDALFGPA